MTSQAGIVGVAISLLCATHIAAAANPITDGESVALELSGELLAPPDMAARFDADFVAIREVEPVLTVVHPHLDWEPGVLMVRLYASAFDQFMAGTYTGLDSLNAEYGPYEVTWVFESIQVIVLDFEAHYNPEVLGPIYETADGVATAHPNGLGFPETDIWAVQEGTYTFYYGWGDCPVGCTSGHFWQYEVDSHGTPTLLDEWGDPLVGVSAPEATRNPSIALGRPRPTPFSAVTNIPLSVPSGVRVRLGVVDVTGRRIRSLLSGLLQEGTRRIAWDGRDETGQGVGTGIYFIVLETTGGERQVQKVTVLR